MKLDPSDLQAIKAQVRMSDLVRGRGVRLRPHGRLFVGLCPFHSERTPSFTVDDANCRYKCFGCGACGDVIDFIMESESCDFSEAIRLLSGGLESIHWVAARVLSRATEKRRKKDETSRQDYAREIWRRARPAHGALVEDYLTWRGIDLAAIGGVPASLRYAPALKHGPTGLWLPAMVAGVQDTAGRVVAVHRTFLTQTGRGKANVSGRKMMLGPCWSHAVRLAPRAPKLALAEGIETALSVLQAARAASRPTTVWAVLSLGNFTAVRLPTWAREVVICADGDGKEPEKAAALLRRAVRRLTRQGRRVRLAKPSDGQDFNDLLQAPEEVEELEPEDA